MLISITGTPGTGKSTTANVLAKLLNAKVLDLEDLARKHKIIVEYDDKTQSMVVDEFKISDMIEKETKNIKNCIVPSHLSHFILPHLVDLCIVLRCDPVVLEKRLEKRGYSKKKVAENMMCEFLDSCLIEAIEMGHKKHLHEIDASVKKPAAIAMEIKSVLEGETKRLFGEIKWLQ